MYMRPFLRPLTHPFPSFSFHKKEGRAPLAAAAAGSVLVLLLLPRVLPLHGGFPRAWLERRSSYRSRGGSERRREQEGRRKERGQDGEEERRGGSWRWRRKRKGREEWRSRKRSALKRASVDENVARGKIDRE